MQLLQNPIAVRPLRLIEDVEAPKPRCQRESHQKQNRNRPREIIDPLGGTRVGLVVRVVRLSAIVHKSSAKVSGFKPIAMLRKTYRIRTCVTRLDSRFESQCPLSRR